MTTIGIFPAYGRFVFRIKSGKISVVSNILYKDRKSARRAGDKFLEYIGFEKEKTNG